MYIAVERGNEERVDREPLVFEGGRTRCDAPNVVARFETIQSGAMEILFVRWIVPKKVDWWQMSM